MEIKKIDKNNYRELALYLSSNFTPKKNSSYYLQKFNYFWERNPSFNDKDLKGYILIDKKKIKGTILNIPIEYISDKNLKFKISCPSFWYVDQLYRSYSINLFLEYFKSNKFIVNSTANKKTIPIFKRLNFIDINTNEKSYIKINNHKLIFKLLKNFMPKKISMLLSKFFFKLYYFFSIILKNKLNLNYIKLIELKKIDEIKKYCSHTKLFFKNIEWFFENKNKKFFIYFNKYNKIKYLITSENLSPDQDLFLEILDTNINNLNIINSFELFYINNFKNDNFKFDYIWVHGIKKKFLFKNFFFSSNRFKKNACLVNDNFYKKFNIEYSALLGEYSIINEK